MSASSASSLLLLPASTAPSPSPSRRCAGAAVAFTCCRVEPSLRAPCCSSLPPVAVSRRFSVQCSAVSNLAELAPAASVAYGTLLLGGGLFAYARTKSTGSISGGVTGAALMAVAYYLMQNPETKAAGEALGFGSASLFASIFGIRLASTRKFMPSGLLLSVSGAAMVVFVSAYLQDKI